MVGWHQGKPGVDETEEDGDHFGSALFTGDFNGDGNLDLVIGVPDEDLGVTENAGAVHILYGSPSGLINTVINDQLWTQESLAIDTENGFYYGAVFA